MIIHFDSLKRLYPNADLQGLTEYYRGKARIAFLSNDQPAESIADREGQTQQHILTAIAHGATRLVLTVKDADGTIYHPDFRVNELLH